MRRILLGAVLLVFGTGAFSQADSTALRYASTITEADLRTYLDTLASDAYEGRETGMKGQKMAAAYILGRLKDFGIPPVPAARERGLMEDGYRQQYPVVLSRPGGLGLAVGDRKYDFMRDYFYFTERLKEDLEATEVMIATPVSLGGMRLGGGSKVVLLLGAGGTGKNMFAELKSAGDALDNTGTQVLLLVEDSARSIMEQYGPLLTQGRMRLPGPGNRPGPAGLQLVVITPELAQAILDKGHLSMKKALRTAARKRVVVKAPIRFTFTSADEMLTAENVLGYVEGGDRKGELVVVTAHYDHVGVIGGEVYNGADDDASGTAAVLEMAQAFATAKAEGHGPRRSMLFMTVSGEEKGLFGSQWYTEHPVFPLDSTVADLNIDMIGRVDTVHGDSSSYVYVIGSKRLSTELGGIVEEQNTTWTQLDLDYTFDADDDPNRFYYRSDHYNFAKHGIPVAFFFNGVHEDYHGPHDEVDKIRFDLLRKRALLVFHVAWELANRDARIVVDRPVGGTE